jgi:hypothetical protein
MAIPVEKKSVPCSLGDGMHAVGHYRTPKGCVARPDDREQDLCAQHVVSDGPIGDDVELILIYDIDFYIQWLGARQVAEVQGST